MYFALLITSVTIWGKTIPKSYDELWDIFDRVDYYFHKKWSRLHNVFFVKDCLHLVHCTLWQIFPTKLQENIVLSYMYLSLKYCTRQLHAVFTAFFPFGWKSPKVLMWISKEWHFFWKIVTLLMYIINDEFSNYTVNVPCDLN